LVLGANGTGLGAGTGVAAVTGPVGAGTLTMAAGTTLLTDNNSRSIFNPVVFSGTPTFDNTNVQTNVSLNLNGPITTQNALVVNVNNPNLTAVFGGALTNAGTLSSITKNGLGNFSMNFTGVSTAVPLTINGGGTLGLLHDGDGDVQNETIAFGAISMPTLPPTVTIGRAGTTTLWNQAINKIIAPSSFSSAEVGLTVNNNNQYQLLLSDAIVLKSDGSVPSFNVATANNSNTLDGLRLSGLISGGYTGATNVVFTKSGPGTLSLTNGGNTFGGSSAIIDVTAGILSVSSNGALGDTSNVIRLTANSGTQGLRLAGGTTYTLTGRTINLNAATVGIDVTAGTVATIDTPFTFSAATNALQKNDLGTLRIDADNSTRTGVTNIAGGVLVVDNANDLGSGQINVISVAQGGSALWLEGGVTLANPIVQTVTANGLVGGINGTGGIFSASGNNTINGTITNSGAFNQTYGVANGATLNFGATAFNTLGNSPLFNTVGNGIINLAGFGANTSAFNKFGTGTMNVTGAVSNTATPIIAQGTFNISGAGQLTGATGNITVNNNALLNIDDTGTAVTRIAGARTVGLANGNLTYTANGAAVSTQAFGALTSSWGANTITLNNAGPSDATLTFASVGAVAGGSVLNFASAGTFNTTTHRVVFTAAPTLTNGIMQRAVIRDASGTNFVTGAAATPISAFSAYTVSDGTGT
jgi:autotransporter-associated beta strand protein